MEENKLNELLEYLGIYEKIENPNVLADLIKKIIRLVPINKPNKVKHAYELISYVEGLLWGDFLRQFLSKEYHSESAKEGISNLIQYAQTQTVTSLKEEKDILEQEIANLKSQKENIGLTLNDLYSQINELSKEQEKYKQNNDNLKQKRQQLEEIINTLKLALTTYEKQISGKMQQQVVNREIIDKTHSICNATRTTINGIIDGLILEYQNKLECSFGDAKLAFKTNCPEIFAIPNLLSKFDYTSTECASIMQIINNKGLNTYHAHLANGLAAILKTLKLPKYQKNLLNMPLISKNSENPESMNGLLRELHFQTQTLNALAAKNIAEQNLQIVINILKQFIPSDFDLDRYLINMNQQGIDGDQPDFTKTL